MEMKDWKAGDVESGSGSPARDYGTVEPTQTKWTTRFVESFKRDPNASITRPGAVTAHGDVYDNDAAAQATANSPLARRLKGRHLQMIAIGGSIGTTQGSGRNEPQESHR